MTTSQPIRVAILADSFTADPAGFLFPFLQALRAELDEPILVIAQEDPHPAVETIVQRQTEIDLVLVFLRFKCLYGNTALLRPISKPLVLIEHDACQNALPNSPYFGAWTKYLRNSPIRLTCVSGLTALRSLEDQGIPCLWLPKGAPETFLRKPYRTVGRFCLFGETRYGVYEHRRLVYDSIRPLTLHDRIISRWKLFPYSYLADRLLRRRGVVHRIHFSYADMPDVLKWYSGCIVCDQGLGEPMIKHFEASALGLAVFRDSDSVQELEQLGYRDGVSMIVYENKEDLREKIGHYGRHLSELAAVQAAGRTAAQRNTWEIRAAKLVNYLQERFGPPLV